MISSEKLRFILISFELASPPGALFRADLPATLW